jgi:NAD(P)-dependent dehydrogenase (short-subunit alcohol dehydrogenase family)
MTDAGSLLSGRTVLITGAAGDIGRAVAVRAGREGAAVVLADRPATESQLHETESSCRAVQPDVDVLAINFDVTDQPAVARSVAALRESGRTPDALFNNAGVQGAIANTATYPLDDVRRVMDVNVTGAFGVLQAWASMLIAEGRPGAAVNSASMAGVAGAPNMPAYSASKAAILGLTKSAAKDLAPDGIRVNAVSPAFIGPGAMWDRQVELQADASSQYYSADPARVADQMIGQVPMRRLGTLDEVASVVVFLLSDQASYLTGVNIEVAGGAS